MTEGNCCERTGCVEKCPCMEQCPLQRTLARIGGKWKIPILCALHQDGATRYNTLKRKISGITNTMLASSLKELENYRLVSRVQYMEMPLRVEYSLTENCAGLIPILVQLAGWGSAADWAGGPERAVADGG